MRHEHDWSVGDGDPVRVELPCDPPVVTAAVGSALLRLLRNVGQQRAAGELGPDEERKAA